MLTRVWLIARREYVERVRTRGFIVGTVLLPLLMGGLVLGSLFLGSKTLPQRQIAVVSSDSELILDLQAQLERQQTPEGSGSQTPKQTPSHITIEAMNPGPAVRSELNGELDSGDLDGYLWIVAAASPGDRPTFIFTSKSGKDSATKEALSSALDKVLVREQLAHIGVAGAETDAMLHPVEIASVQSGPYVDHDSALISVSVLFFVMYLVIMLYGMNVARSIIEEKSSRIFEVLLSTVRPEAMMAGKIIGVGSVGLTQVGIWLGAALLLTANSAPINLGGDAIHLSLTAGQVFYFLIYFILGYLFYSAIAAALGAMTNTEQELQQLNLFLMLPLLVSFFMLGPLVSAPDSTLARILALIPPFTPLIMYMRVSLGHPKPWEIALSLVLLSLSIYGLIWVTSRIYRVGVLMYGKRPGIREMLRWLRYS
jgi:ABC-2 type transport system permease protein